MSEQATVTIPTAAKKRTKMKFRLLAGFHAQPEERLAVDEHSEAVIDPDTGKQRCVVVNIQYRAGDIVETTTDLERRFNMGPSARKFEKIHETVEAAAAAGFGAVLADNPGVRRSDESKASWAARLAEMARQAAEEASFDGSAGAVLDSMSEKELLAFAAAEEIDLRGAKSRDAVLAAVKRSQGTPATPTTPTAPAPTSAVTSHPPQKPQQGQQPRR